MQNIEGIECNLPNVLSRVLTVKDMLQPVIKCFVIPEGGLEYLIAKLLDRTYILIQLVQVGSYIYFNTSRAGWQLARVVMVAEDAESKELPHTIKLLDLGKRYNVHLAEEKLTTVSEETGTWCWHVDIATKCSKKFLHAI